MLFGVMIIPNVEFSMIVGVTSNLNTPSVNVQNGVNVKFDVVNVGIYKEENVYSPSFWLDQIST